MINALHLPASSRKLKLSLKSQYTADFWRHNIEKQLLWVVYPPSAGRPQSYIAPSWSWLPIDSDVYVYDSDQDARVILNILDVCVTHFKRQRAWPNQKWLYTCSWNTRLCHLDAQKAIRLGVPIHSWPLSFLAFWDEFD